MSAAPNVCSCKVNVLKEERGTSSENGKLITGCLNGVGHPDSKLKVPNR